MKLSRLAGFHAVQARLERHPDSVLEVYALAGREDQRMVALESAVHAAGLELKRVDERRLAALAQSDEHGGVVALAEPVQLAASLEQCLSELAERRQPAPLLLLLDQVQDPHNLGACLRSAAAFGVDAVVVPRHGSAPLSAAAQKAASGALEWVPLLEVANLAQAIAAVQQAGLWVLGAEMEAETTLFDTPLTGPMAWVLGNEGRGLRRLTRERCDRLVRIPMQGPIESLNVSTATAVCLFATQAARHRALAEGLPASR